MPYANKKPIARPAPLAPLAIWAGALLLAAAPLALAQKKGKDAAEEAAPASFYDLLGVPQLAPQVCATLGNIGVEAETPKVSGLDDASQRVLRSTFEVFGRTEKIGERIKAIRDQNKADQEKIAEARKDIAALAQKNPALKRTTDDLLARLEPGGAEVLSVPSPSPADSRRLLKLAQQVQERQADIADRTARIPEMQADILAILPRAIPLLRKALAGERLSPGGRAVAWNYLAYVHGEQEDYKQAREAYENLIREPGATPAQKRPAHYTSGQIAISEEDYQAGITHLESWFGLTRTLGREFRPANYYLLGQAYYQARDGDKALDLAQKTLDLARCLDTEPAEGWLKFVAGLLAQRERLEDALLPTQMLVLLYPKREYWLQLQQIYSAREDFAARTTALHLAYELELLEKEREYVGLAQALVERGIPMEAAKILREGLEKEIVEATGSHLSQLGGMYHRAGALDEAIRYYDRGVEAYGKEDKKDKQTQYLSVQAQLLSQEGRFEQALQVLDRLVELDPKPKVLGEALNRKARVLDELGRVSEALELLAAVEDEEFPGATERARLIEHLQRQIDNARAYKRFMTGIKKATEELRQGIADSRR